MQKLSAQEYTFFSKFVRAVLSNPFKDVQHILAALNTGEKQERQESNMHFFKVMQPKLNQQLASLNTRHLNQLAHFNGMEQRVMYYTFIVAIYLDFVADLDKYIKRHLADKHASTKFPSGVKILTQLRQRGFSDSESIRLLELFYQFRRAYVFFNEQLIGDCPSMMNLRMDLWNNLFTFDVPNYHSSLWDQMEDFSLFLVGETGTGKGVAAKVLGWSGHILYNQQSQSFQESFKDIFVESNLSQYSESLIESELFGHKKGAFTGALDNFQGLFSQCKQNGSLFLDEIGDISENIQIKLLKVLQERTFTPVGSPTKEHFHGRILAAANQSLYELREDGRLRDDFFYRLCSDIIEIPTLRKRLDESEDELVILTAELVKRICHKSDENIVSLVIDSLNLHVDKNYPWPGNVRELEQAIRRIILRGSYYGDIYKTKAPAPNNTIIDALIDNECNVKDLITLYCQTLYQSLQTYEAVSKKTGLDRRTVKKYIDNNSLD